MTSTIARLTVLVVPAERFPTNESFVDRVLSRTRDDERRVMLMQADDPADAIPRVWNDAELVVFRTRPRSRWLRWLKVYFTDLRYLPLLWRLLRRRRPATVLVRDMTFPLVVALATRPFFRHRIVYQKTFPNEIRWFDPELVDAHRWPWLWRVCRRLEEQILHRAMRHAEAVLPISDGMGQQLSKRWGIAPDRMFAFGMGVDPEEVDPASNRTWTEGEEFRWVYLGTLGHSRRLENMLAALARVREHRPDLAMSLDVVGGLPEEVERLRREAEERGLGDIVHVWGRRPRVEAFQRVRSAHASLVYIPRDPRYTIASPAKLIESLALGVPAVSTDACRMTDTLADETGGVVVRSDGIEDFASGMIEMVQSHAVYAQRLRENRQEFVRRHSYERMRERLASILDSFSGSVREE